MITAAAIMQPLPVRPIEGPRVGEAPVQPLPAESGEKMQPLPYPVFELGNGGVIDALSNAALISARA